MLRSKLRDRFEAAVRKGKLTKHGDELMAEARECVHVHYGKPAKRVALGASRIGGNPDLPESVEWPDGMHGGKAGGKAEFLAQFNLAELPEVEGLGLPRAGHLWLFVRDTSLCDPPVAVMYRDEGEALAPRTKPGKPSKRDFGWRDLKMAPLKFSPGVSLPFSSKAFARKWESRSLPDDALNDLREALGGDLDSYGPRDGIDGQIGGYSYQAEHDLCREIAIEQLGKPEYVYADEWENVAQLEEQIKRGLPFANAGQQDSYRGELRKHVPGVKWIEANESRIASAAASIRLLCMFRPNGDIGLEFGDGMFLDFLIHERALAERDFSRIECRLPMLL